MVRLFSSGRSQFSALSSVEDGGEEVPVHTVLNPYCDKLGCWCHTDVQYHASVTGATLRDGVEDDQYDYALGLFGIVE